MRPSRFAARKGPVTTQGLAFGRSRWRDLLTLSSEVAAAKGVGLALDPFKWADFKARLEKTPPSGLPLERWGVSGAQAYQAFMAAGRGLIVAAEPRRIQTFATLLGTAARLLEELLDDAATHDAQTTWGRQFPAERD